MAKRTRRTRPNAPKLPARHTPAAPASVSPVAQVKEQPLPPPPCGNRGLPQAPKKQVDFATQYRYVLGDLRKMAVIAATMLVLLIALSLVVR